MEIRRFVIRNNDNYTCDCVDLLTGERENYRTEWKAAKVADQKMKEAVAKGEPCMVIQYHDSKGNVIRVKGVK